MNIPAPLIYRARCDRADKEALLPELAHIINLVHKGRSEGLLSLVEDIPQIRNEFFRVNLKRVTDGYRPEALEQVMLITIAAHRFRGKQLLRHLMIAVGVHGIQKAEYPQFLADELIALLEPDRAALMPKLQTMIPQASQFLPKTQLIINIQAWIRAQQSDRQLIPPDDFIVRVVRATNPFAFDRLIGYHTALAYFIWSLPLLPPDVEERLLYNLTPGTLAAIHSGLKGKHHISGRRLYRSYQKLSKYWLENIERGLIPNPPPSHNFRY